MSKDPNNPFNWRMRTEPSIFARDPYFRPKADGKTDSQRATDVVESKRKASGKDHGTIKALGASTKEKEQRLLSFRQFGVYSKAMPSTKKPNKHEK